MGCDNVIVAIYQSDVDECSTTRRPCGVNKHCVNTPGSYKCSCNSGYKEARNGNCEGKVIVIHLSHLYSSQF